MLEVAPTIRRSCVMTPRCLARSKILQRKEESMGRLRFAFLALAMLGAFAATPAAAQGTNWTGFKIPAAACTRVFGDASPDLLFLGSGTVTLQGSGFVSFNCPVTATRGTLTGIKVYYSDSDGPHSLSDLGSLRVGLVRTILEPTDQGPRFSAAELCVMDTGLPFNASPKAGPTTTLIPCSLSLAAGEFYFLEIRLLVNQEGGVVSFMGAEFR